MTARRRARVAAPLLGLCLLALVPAPPTTAAADTRPAALPVLTSVHARHVGNVDRVVFRFIGGVPTSVHAEWVDTLVHDGSGLPVRVAGGKVLSIAMLDAVAHDQSGSTVARRTAFALPNALTAVGAGDFEGAVLFGVGVQKQASFRVRVQAHRVIVEIGASFPVSVRKVFLVDDDANVVSVQRRVPSATPAGGALHALFAGPTPSERSDGLRLVRSRAWGFRNLGIADGIARLRLTRGCNSGGATTTIASEIVPTLKQFTSVDWVKIYSPGGRTEQPSGPSDSIPICLEP